MERAVTASNIRHLLIALAAGAATPAAAQQFQDISAIEQRVVAALGAGIGQPGGPARAIDRRLRLMACPAPLIVEPVTLGAVTVRCQQIGWRLRVPVTMVSTSSPAAVDITQLPEAPAEPAARPVRTARAEPVVHRGDPVSLMVISGGFTVARQAVADQDGAPGERIRVRTEPRAAPIVGQVMADGRVAMTGFN
jgi:flagellar basal body P-ring formation protein FlgA